MIREKGQETSQLRSHRKERGLAMRPGYSEVNFGAMGKAESGRGE